MTDQTAPAEGAPSVASAPPVRPAPSASAAPAPKRGLRRRLGDTATALLVIGMLKLILHMPERPMWALASMAGRLSYRVSRGRREHAGRNLRRILDWMAATGQGPESVRAAATNQKAFDALLCSAFVNHALYYVEMARISRFDTAWVEARLEVVNPAEVDVWMVPGKALILIGMHFGAIEVPGVFAVSRLKRIVSPMESVANARIQRYIYTTRDSVGIRLIDLQEAGTELLATLRRNEAVGLVADRVLTNSGMDVELFGAPSKIPAGPVLLCAETGAPVYMSAVRRIGPGRYRGGVRKLEPAAGATRRERSRAMARAEAALFEQFIIEAPEQWLALFHPIWPDLELRDAKLGQPAMQNKGDRA
jgi:phosphatidylinositol dimannoside acyltransferase